MPAGTYHFVLDCIVTSSADITFELFARHDGNDRGLARWAKRFDPASNIANAQAYDVEKQADAIEWTAGDQLVLRYTAEGSTDAEAWIPNGDGTLARGRIPSIALPTE